MNSSNSDISPDLFSELLLWKKVREGSKESFDQLFQLYIDFLYNYGIKFGADAATTEDSIQDFFLYIWQKRKKITIKDSVKFYFLRSFRRILLKKLTAQKKKSLHFSRAEDYPFYIQLSQEDILVQHDTTTAIRHKINRSLDFLSPRQKEAIFLRYYENFDNEEIAQIMNISIGSLYKLISAAIKRLRKKF